MKEMRLLLVIVNMLGLVLNKSCGCKRGTCREVKVAWWKSPNSIERER